MKEEDYTIDYLIDVFQKHSTEYKMKNPEERINKDFNICEAFLIFAKEIKKCRDWIEEIHNG